MEINSNTLCTEEKYRLYEESVQNHEGDIDFINKNYKLLYDKAPLTLREDFGGTAVLACSWTTQSPNHKAYAIDFDQAPISYGVENHYSKLNEDEKNRMTYIKGNVLDTQNYKADVIVAFNFSYFIFKRRKELLEYFSKVKDGLSTDGVFIIDLFGGTDAREPMVEETEHDDFSYFWDCENYNPITHECQYAIHFKTSNNNTKFRDVFTYDWRLWGLAELREILEDAGFKETRAFWEGEDGDGGGDGEFYITNKGENCESWVTYIMAIP